VIYPVLPGMVSIVVASYNHSGYLKARMESLINQTYQSIEIIVIDDCSTDDSLVILREYESNPRVRLIQRESNGGWITVSNQGIEISKGEFVLFANCDDFCQHDMVEKLVARIEGDSDIGISFCRSLMVDEDNAITGDDFQMRERSFKKLCHQNVVIEGSNMSRFLLHSCVIPNLSAALIRRECFTTLGGLSSAFRLCSDWEFFFRVATGYKFSYSAASMNSFRQHKNTIRSSTKLRITYEEYLRLLLSEISNISLSSGERVKFRVRAMELWASYLVGPSLAGIRDFPFHLKLVTSLDKAAIVFLPYCMVIRSCQLLVKVTRMTLLPKNK
jgi:glycosyltransferase involved in cell wall biosynthesis